MILQVVHNLKSVSTQDTFKTVRRALPKFAIGKTILVLNIGYIVRVAFLDGSSHVKFEFSFHRSRI